PRIGDAPPSTPAQATPIEEASIDEPPIEGLSTHDSDDPLADLDGLEFELPPGEPPTVPGSARPDEGPDPVLLEIFRSEAQRNLTLLSDWLTSLDPDLSEHTVDDAVHRALHTLKGSARMAEIDAMA